MFFIASAYFTAWSIAILSGAAVAQEPGDSPNREIEEVVVVGDKSLVTLKHAVYRAEEEFFAIFNAQNSDDEFDVHCRYEAKTGTRIRKHTCEANFL
ncbi:MAG: hypothetical protein AAGI27_15090, partial [Pseudomonadota bacterium]